MPIPSMSRRARSAAQRAFGFASPVERQCAGDGFDEPKVFVRGGGEKGGISPPGCDDDEESAEKRSAFKCAAASLPTSRMCRFTSGQPPDGTLGFGFTLLPLG